MSRLAEIAGMIEPPVCIISSRAGLGNYSVGLALSEVLSSRKSVCHQSIEGLISEDAVARDFRRYRVICSVFPCFLRFIYGVPVSYMWKYGREYLARDSNCERLRDRICSLRIRTVVATNHRAVLKLSAMRRRKQIDCSLWAFLTDYHLNAGWKYLFWDEVERFLGPINSEKIPRRLRGKYTCVDLPIQVQYAALSSRTGNGDHILITGGGWGLGAIPDVTRTLHRNFPHLTLHVACGDNERLFAELDAEFCDTSNVIIYGFIESLVPLMERCGAVITKPGAVTITEAYAAKRMIFLIKGLPVTEEENAHHAIRNFGAQWFSIDAFSKWKVAG